MIQHPVSPKISGPTATNFNLCSMINYLQRITILIRIGPVHANAICRKVTKAFFHKDIQSLQQQTIRFLVLQQKEGKKKVFLPPSRVSRTSPSLPNAGTKIHELAKPTR